MAQLTLSHVSFTYPQTERAAVCDVSCSIGRGEFVAICGATGSGKSSLLRLLKRELTPLGTLSGEIRFMGTELAALSNADAAAKIGFVLQRPEQQIVTDKVWHELAFGLENLHIPQEIIARRIAEMASWFGISQWFDRDVSTLSGGQKQLLNLAAVMVMQPDILILDEPTAQLDPIAAVDFLNTLRRLCTEFSLTILIAEHRLEDVVPLCDRLLIMEDGALLHDGAPRDIIAKLRQKPEILCAMPAAARLHCALELPAPCPLTVREGRDMLETRYCNTVRALPQNTPVRNNAAALTFRDVYFRYGRHEPDVVSGLSLEVHEGEIFCILGGNGSGKSTALQLAARLQKPHAGDIRVFGKRLKDYKNQSLYNGCLATLPQDVQTVFLRNTVAEELAEMPEVQLPFDLRHLYSKHPYDLSGGEQQLCALAKVLAQQPQLLLLDEPTKGLDAHTKQKFTAILRALQAQGMTIVIVTHDTELAADCADRCALFFRGNVVSVDAPRKFFAESSFYTTAVSRMTRQFFDNAVTVEDAAALCRRNQRRDLRDRDCQ